MYFSSLWIMHPLFHTWEGRITTAPLPTRLHRDNSLFLTVVWMVSCFSFLHLCIFCDSTHKTNLCERSFIISISLGEAGSVKTYFSQCLNQISFSPRLLDPVKQTGVLRFSKGASHTTASHSNTRSRHQPPCPSILFNHWVKIYIPPLSFLLEINIAKYFSVTNLRTCKYIKSKTKYPTKQKKHISHETGPYMGGGEEHLYFYKNYYRIDSKPLQDKWRGILCPVLV